MADAGKEGEVARIFFNIKEENWIDAYSDAGKVDVTGSIIRNSRIKQGKLIFHQLGAPQSLEASTLISKYGLLSIATVN